MICLNPVSTPWPGPWFYLIIYICLPYGYPPPPETYFYVRIQICYPMFTPWPGPYFYRIVYIVKNPMFTPWPGPYSYLIIYISYFFTPWPSSYCYLISYMFYFIFYPLAGLLLLPHDLYVLPYFYPPGQAPMFTSQFTCFTIFLSPGRALVLTSCCIYVF